MDMLPVAGTGISCSAISDVRHFSTKHIHLPRVEACTNNCCRTREGADLGICKNLAFLREEFNLNFEAQVH